jgi:hypothetical protein
MYSAKLAAALCAVLIGFLGSSSSAQVSSAASPDHYGKGARKAITGLNSNLPEVAYYASSADTRPQGAVPVSLLKDTSGAFLPINEFARNGMFRLHLGGRNYWFDPKDFAIRRVSAIVPCAKAKEPVLDAANRGVADGCRVTK